MVEHHGEMKPSASLSRIHNWVLEGKPFSDWSVWLALDTYFILAKEFGFDSYQRLFTKYYTLPYINSENDRLDLWARRYSEEVNTNLCPYFEWFQWPLSQDTKDFCKTLPAWDKDPLSGFQRITQK